MRLELASVQHEPSDHDKYFRPDKPGRVSWHLYLHVKDERFKIDTGTTREQDARRTYEAMTKALFGAEVKT